MPRGIPNWSFDMSQPSPANDDSPIEQAAAITLRMAGGSPQILLVSGKKNPAHWIFPKGHIESGECAQDTAVRELLEEAGAEGQVLEKAGLLEFEAGERSVRVEHYLVKFVAQVHPGDGRQCRWRSYEDALDLLSFEDTRKLLRAARGLIERHFPAENHG